MSNLIYKDENRELIDSSSAGARGKGVLLLIISPAILAVTLALIVLLIAEVVNKGIHGSIPGVILFGLTMTFIIIVLLFLSLVLFVGGLYGISIRNLRIFHDHIELSTLWKRIERKDLILVIDDMDGLENNRGRLLELNRRKSVLERAFYGAKWMDLLKKKMEDEEIIIVIYRKRNSRETFEVLTKEEHRNIMRIGEVLDGLIISTAEAERRSRMLLEDDRTVKIVPVLDEELRRRIKRRYLPPVTAISIIGLAIIISFVLFGHLLVGLSIAMFWLLYLFFNIVCFLAMVPANKNCSYEIREGKLVIQNPASMFRYETGFDNIKRMSKLKENSYNNIFRLNGLKGKNRLVVTAFTLKNLYILELKVPIRPITSFQDVTEKNTIILSDDEEWTGYRALKMRMGTEKYDGNIDKSKGKEGWN